VTRINDIKLSGFFAERLPKRQQILGLYAVIVFLVYSWTLLTSFYKLSSWMFYLTISQILSIYAYAFSADLLESILLLAGILFIDLTLFLFLTKKEEFLPRSALVAVALLASSMSRLLVFQEYETSAAFVSGEALWWIIAFAIGFPLAIVAPKNKWLRGIFEGFSERVTIFLYIYLPLSFISLIVVFIRNISWVKI
jgi:hypothetical protein